MMKKKLGQEESKNIPITVLGIIDGDTISGEMEDTMEILMLTEEGQVLTHSEWIVDMSLVKLAKQKETQMVLSKKIQKKENQVIQKKMRKIFKVLFKLMQHNHKQINTLETNLVQVLKVI